MLNMKMKGNTLCSLSPTLRDPTIHGEHALHSFFAQLTQHNSMTANNPNDDADEGWRSQSGELPGMALAMGTAIGNAKLGWSFPSNWARETGRSGS